jgi:Flp pilus assembly protein TadG
VESALLASLYFLFLFGLVEFAWIGIRRQALLNGATKAARAGAVGGTIATMRSALRQGSGLTVPDGTITLEFCSTDDGSGTWSGITDDAASGSPPLANAVPVGRPVRARVVAWPHRMLTGAFFSWLAGSSVGQLPLSASGTMRRE